MSSETFELMGVECMKRNDRFLIDNVDVVYASEQFEQNVHMQFVSNGNVFALKNVPAMYKNGKEVAHTTILVPTTENTRIYLIINEGFNPLTDIFDTTSLSVSDKTLVAFSLDKVGRSDQINRGMVDGVAYIDEHSITEMERALDM